MATSYTFGQLPEHSVVDRFGNVQSGLKLSVYASQSDATSQINVLASPVTDSTGRWTYVDASRSLVWVRTPKGTVYPVKAQEASDGSSGGGTTPTGSFNTLLNGTGDPAPALGNNGDFYIANDTHYLYGPKAAGSWPGGTSIIGPSASTGNAYRPTSLQITNPIFYGQSGHPFTFAGTGAVGNNNDTTDFVLGSRSVKVTTPGNGVQTKISGTFSSAIDMTGKMLVIWLKVDGIANLLGGYPRIYLGDLALTNAYYWKLNSSSGQPFNLDGEWMRVTLPFGTATTVGAPSRNSLASMTIQHYDNSAGQTTFHFGGLALAPEPSQWPNGVVSFTFDDGYMSHYTQAKPYLDKYGYAATEFLICEGVYNNATYPSYMNMQQCQTLENQSDWEVSTHAYTFANHSASYTGISDAAALADMAKARDWIRANGFRGADIFAYPLGNFNANTVQNVRAIFSCGRSISQFGGFVDETFPPADISRLRCMTLGSANTLASAQQAVDRAFANKEWLVFCMHDIVTTATTNLQWSIANFQALVDYVNTKTIPVRKVSDVLKSA
ncbi:MAG: polysaccharide deacetylase family protein [Mycobacteriaceae bacterium]